MQSTMAPSAIIPCSAWLAASVSPCHYPLLLPMTPRPSYSSIVMIVSHHKPCLSWIEALSGFSYSYDLPAPIQNLRHPTPPQLVQPTAASVYDPLLILECAMSLDPTARARGLRDCHCPLNSEFKRFWNPTLLVDGVGHPPARHCRERVFPWSNALLH